MARIAYADPPYPGMAGWCYGMPEVDHAALLAELQDYDGWVLHTAMRTLQAVLALCPQGVRVAAWCKPNAAARRQWNPNHAWEPVIWRPARKRSGPYINDWLVTAVPIHLGSDRGPFWGSATRSNADAWSGQKPRAVVRWCLELLGVEADDVVVDMFPGTGAVTQAWKQWRDARPHMREAELAQRCLPD